MVLGGANTFTGNVALNAGTLSISSDGNLGDTANDVVFGGGTLAATSSLTLGVDRSVSGSAGTLKVGAGNTLTIDGTVALSGALTLSDAGSVALTNASTKTVGSVVLTTTGTLETVNGGLTVAGNLTANGGSGTATINAPLTLSATSTTVTVANGGTLDLSQDVDLSSGSSSRLITAGPGTLILGGTMTSTNAGSGVRIGSSSATPTNGGTVQVSSAGALGTGQLQFNYGTLNATSALSITQGISMGGREGAAITFAGSDIDVTGTLTLFAGSEATGAHRINVNNNTTFSSAFNNTAATDGLTIGGNGSLTLAAASTNVDDNILLTDSVKLVVNGDLTGSTGSITVATGTTLSGSGTVAGGVTIQSNGTLAVGNSTGTQTFGSTLEFESGSIFDWELDASTSDTGASNQGTYDKVIADGAVSGTSIFTIALGTNGFADLFWETNKSWTDIFTGTGSFDLASIFINFGGSGVASNGFVAGEGQFGFTGSTLTWTAVPEPSSALAGLLIAAGLLRRRRVA